MHSTRISTAPLVLLLSLATATLPATDWPQFRGPDSQGVSEAKGIPSSWSPGENLLWKRELPGRGASSPIALGDRLYLTAYSGYGTYPEKFGEMSRLTLHVFCLSPTDGSTIWEKKLSPALPESESVRDHGYAAPTPATDGKHLYAFFGKSGVYKFDLEGNRIWHQSVGTGTHRWGCGTSPVLFEDVVIINASVESGDLVGIDKESGKIRWRQGGMNRSWNTPHLVKVPDGGTELAVSVKDKILGFDPQSGKSLWTCEGIPDYICPSIVSRDGILYAMGGRQSRAVAIRAGGRGDVTETHRLWVAQAGANVSSPVIHDGHLYWVSDRNKNAYCLRLSDGEVVSRRRFPGQPYASALLVDDRVYIVTRHEGTYVLKATPEFPELSHNELDDESTFNASPVVAHGRLYLRSDRALYCIGSKS